MESPENESAVFRPSHKPWKSIKPIPTFPPPRRPRAICETIPKRSRPRCPLQSGRSGSSLDWKRLLLDHCKRARFQCMVPEYDSFVAAFPPEPDRLSRTPPRILKPLADAYPPSSESVQSCGVG